MDYLRVSTEEQRGGYGIAGQARRNRRFVDSRGWEHLDSYTDEGVSGAKGMGSRRGFDRLMHDAEKRPRILSEDEAALLKAKATAGVPASRSSSRSSGSRSAGRTSS